MLKYYYRLLTGKTDAKNPAKLTFRNIIAVIQAYFRRSIQGFTVPSHVWEQTIWRRTEVMKSSPDCWKKGNCIECGCEILGKTIEDRKCDSGCYPSMMKKEEWKKYKKDNNIKLFE